MAEDKAAKATPPQELRGDALKERAAELNVEGRTEMNADELRDAVARAERETAVPPQDRERQAAAEEDSRKFTKSRYLESSGALLGHPLHVVAAALGDVEDEKEMTVSAASRKINTFLKSEDTTVRE